MSAEKYLTLEQAAARLGTDTRELLLIAAAGEIPIAVYADSWAAIDGTETESGTVDLKPGTGRILRRAWLYMDAGYVPRFLDRRPDEAIQPGGKFKSRSDGLVDTWIQKKPFIRPCDLRVLAADIEQRLHKAAEADAKGSGADRYATWQRAAEEYAARYTAQHPGRVVTKEKAAAHVGRMLDVPPATVERNIRKTWTKPRRKGRFA